MADQSPGSRTVEVDDDVYDVLERTAASRDADINSALRYLIEVPMPRTGSDDKDRAQPSGKQSPSSVTLDSRVFARTLLALIL
ncbi:hypothetical protein ACLQ24_28085 [Micromonospora sp. DT4]|uniref:hypothetical protein n=1 Tax=Micromonospora sp. DT4 TaxID=3393438 RepID=UPI003CF24082